jgi:hypothetical protein
MTTAPVLPSELNKRIADWIQFFTVKDRDRTERFFERGLPLRAHIEKILKENDVPPEFFYLAMISSWYSLRFSERSSGAAIASRRDY